MSTVHLSNSPTADVLRMVEEHEGTWSDKDVYEWLAGLVEEVGELAESLKKANLAKAHHELTQIASIAINFRIHLNREANSERNPAG